METRSYIKLMQGERSHSIFVLPLLTSIYFNQSQSGETYPGESVLAHLFTCGHHRKVRRKSVDF